MKKRLKYIKIITILIINVIIVFSFNTRSNAEDKTSLKITMEYKYNSEDNTVTGIMHSNNQLKNTKVSWTLSEDGLTYTNSSLKTNGSYTTTVEDIYGNKADVLINVTRNKRFFCKDGI